METIAVQGIGDLIDSPLAIGRLAVLLSEEWGSVSGRSVFEIEAGLRKWCRKDALPWGLVAMVGSEPAGIAAVLGDDGDHPTAAPWLSTVFVAARFRDRGLGRALVQAGEVRAAHLGYRALYLRTRDKAPLYRRWGWEPFATRRECGHPVVVMRRALP